jgi:hypothetical protein
MSWLFISKIEKQGLQVKVVMEFFKSGVHNIQNMKIKLYTYLKMCNYTWGLIKTIEIGQKRHINKIQPS